MSLPRPSNHSDPITLSPNTYMRMVDLIESSSRAEAPRRISLLPDGCVRAIWTGAGRVNVGDAVGLKMLRDYPTTAEVVDEFAPNPDLDDDAWVASGMSLVKAEALEEKHKGGNWGIALTPAKQHDVITLQVWGVVNTFVNVPSAGLDSTVGLWAEVDTDDVISVAQDGSAKVIYVDVAGADPERRKAILFLGAAKAASSSIKLAYAKERINANGSGKVYLAEEQGGNGLLSTIPSTKEFTVRNPWCGDIFEGYSLMFSQVEAKRTGPTGAIFSDWCVLPMPQNHKAKAVSTIAANASGTVNIYPLVPGGGSAGQVTVYHDWITGASPIESTHDLYITWFNGKSWGPGDHDPTPRWRITSADCPTSGG
jgi:hypothetical protein